MVTVFVMYDPSAPAFYRSIPRFCFLHALDVMDAEKRKKGPFLCIQSAKVTKKKLKE